MAVVGTGWITNGYTVRVVNGSSMEKKDGLNFSNLKFDSIVNDGAGFFSASKREKFSHLMETDRRCPAI